MKTEQEIKMLLSGISAPETHADSHVREAWMQVKQNPELMHWYETQRAFDERVGDLISRTHVPEELKQEILQQAAFVKAKRSGWFRSWMSGAIAATILLFAGLFLFRDSLINNQDLMYLPRWSSMEKEGNFRDAMAVFVDDTLINLDFLSSDRNSIQQWLVGQGGAQLKRFPESVDTMNTLGCKTLKWKGRTVSLVCFHYDNNRILHLFVMDRKGTAEALIQNLEGMKRVRNLETGGWLTPTHAVMLVGSDPDVKVGPLLDQSSI